MSNSNYFLNFDLSDFKELELSSKDSNSPLPNISRAHEIKQILSNMDSFHKLKAEDKEKVSKLEEELLGIQHNCWHSWEKVILFSSIRMICSKCDKEDIYYNTNGK
jgi:hypothetical protein